MSEAKREVCPNCGSLFESVYRTVSATGIKCNDAWHEGFGEYVPETEEEIRKHSENERMVRWLTR